MSSSSSEGGRRGGTTKSRSSKTPQARGIDEDGDGIKLQDKQRKSRHPQRKRMRSHIAGDPKPTKDHDGSPSCDGNSVGENEQQSGNVSSGDWEIVALAVLKQNNDQPVPGTVMGKKLSPFLVRPNGKRMRLKQLITSKSDSKIEMRGDKVCLKEDGTNGGLAGATVKMLQISPPTQSFEKEEENQASLEEEPLWLKEIVELIKKSDNGYVPMTRLGNLLSPHVPRSLDGKQSPRKMKLSALVAARPDVLRIGDHQCVYLVNTNNDGDLSQNQQLEKQEGAKDSEEISQQQQQQHANVAVDDIAVVGPLAQALRFQDERSASLEKLQSLLSSRLRGHSVLEIVEENPQFFALLNNGQTVQMVEEPQQKGKKEDKKSENNPNKVERESAREGYEEWEKVAVEGVSASEGVCGTGSLLIYLHQNEFPDMTLGKLKRGIRLSPEFHLDKGNMVFHTSVDSYEELMSRHAVLVRDIASLILENNRGWLRLDALVLLMRSFIKERGAAFRPRKKLSMDKPNMMDLSDDELQSLSSITRAGVIARHFSRYMEESFRVFVRRRENEENDAVHSVSEDFLCVGLNKPDDDIPNFKPSRPLFSRNRFVHFHPKFVMWVEEAAKSFRLPPAVVEKDYWISHAMWCMQQVGFEIELKGGMSLSKGYGVLHRISEDVDIAIRNVVRRSEAGQRNVKHPSSIDFLSRYMGPKGAKGRKRWFALIEAILVNNVPGARVHLGKDNELFFDDLYRQGIYWIEYPTHFIPKSDWKPAENILFPSVALEVGGPNPLSCFMEPRHMESIVHEYLRKSGMKAWDLFENVPAPVMCMHPRVTLWQKIYDGIVYRFPRMLRPKDEGLLYKDDEGHFHMGFDARIARHYQDAADIITAIRQGRCDLSPYWSSSVQAKQHAAILRDPYKLFAYLVTNSGLRLKLKADTTPRPLSPDLSIELPAALYENRSHHQQRRVVLYRWMQADEENGTKGRFVAVELSDDEVRKAEERYSIRCSSADNNNNNNNNNNNDNNASSSSSSEKADGSSEAKDANEYVARVTEGKKKLDLLEECHHTRAGMYWGEVKTVKECAHVLRVWMVENSM